jgi:hypothetical protein
MGDDKKRTSAEWRIIEAELAERSGQIRQAAALWTKAAYASADNAACLRCLAEVDRLRKLL